MLINRGRGYKNVRYLLLKAKRIAVTNTEYVAFHKITKAAQNATLYKFLRRASFLPAPAHLALHCFVAAVANVFEQEQAQNDIGRRAQPAAGSAFGAPF